MERKEPAKDRGAVEIWFDFGSPYSYLSAMRIEDVAASHGFQVRWKAMLLGPIFQALGWQSLPILAHDGKAHYVWRDMERQTQKYQLPWIQPSIFPRTAVLPSRVVVFGEDEPWIGEFVRGVMRLNFADDAEVDNDSAVRRVLDRLDVSSASILTNAKSPEIKQQLRQQTELALERGIFGAPTFFANGEMFWGNDRLEDALNYPIVSSGRTEQKW